MPIFCCSLLFIDVVLIKLSIRHVDDFFRNITHTIDLFKRRTRFVEFFLEFSDLFSEHIVNDQKMCLFCRVTCIQFLTGVKNANNLKKKFYHVCHPLLNFFFSEAHPQLFTFFCHPLPTVFISFHFIPRPSVLLFFI